MGVLGKGRNRFSLIFYKANIIKRYPIICEDKSYKQSYNG